MNILKLEFDWAEGDGSLHPHLFVVVFSAT